MLDLKFIRNNPEAVKKACQDKGEPVDIDELLVLDDTRRKIVKEADDLRNKLNTISRQIGATLKIRGDISSKKEEAKKISEKIKRAEEKEKEINKKIKNYLLRIPNIPYKSVPRGDATCNKIVSEWGNPPDFAFEPRDHIEIAGMLDIIDFERAAKMTGSNFVLFKGWGARLERVLINFMLDIHTTQNNYKEIFPPFVVNRNSMTATAQLPKLEEDMYALKDEDFFLIPTAEVPLTNIHQDEILKKEQLPLYYTAYTACFRREAGSYGKDTRGLVRVHQFDKVELVKIVYPDNSYDELEKLRQEAEKILQLLGLQYRVVLLASGDLSFAASKCYDLEAYAPGLKRWLEVSSCSNFEDFQARRANIRFRDKEGKLRYVHTLNGSGIALARTVICLMETYQNEDGTITVPEVLRPYLGGIERIGPES